jgi:hypothetical protein
MSLGPVDLALRPGTGVTHARSAEQRRVDLWNGSSLIFLDPLRAEVVPGADQTLALELREDGSRVELREGTYRFARRGKEVVALQTPNGVALQRVAKQAPAEEAAQAAAAGAQTLANGAVVTTRGWGKLEVRRQDRGYVVVAGPGGDLVLGPQAKVTLARETGATRLETPDGRFVRHEDGAGRMLTRLEQDGLLRVELFSGEDYRVLEVERGTEVDLTVRPDRYVLAFVFGQAVYLEPGRRMSVTQASGLRTFMARERSGR